MILATGLKLTGGEGTMADLTGKKALIVIASQNFRDEEFTEPCELLKKAGVIVTIASSKTDVATGMLGKKVKPDSLVSAVKAADYDMVIFVGGSGASEYFNSSAAHVLARDAVTGNKILGAICLAPAILARAGILKGKKATCFSAVREFLRNGGAEVQPGGLVVDGKIITADGPQSAKPFAAALLQALAK